MDSEGFSQAGLNTNRIKKREPVTPQTQGCTRNTDAVWLVTDASDRADDGPGREVADTVGTARVLAAPRLTCLIALGVDSVSWEGDWRDVT